MNSNPLSRLHYASHQNLPLQSLTDNNLHDRYQAQRRSKDRLSQKMSVTGFNYKPTEPQAFLNNDKFIKEHYKSQENFTKAKPDRTQAKLNRNKENLMTVPSQGLKGNNDKNFKDLNKSLANLALRRVVSKSSSENDGFFQSSALETDPNQYTRDLQSHNPDGHLFYNPSDAVKTPCVTKRPLRGVQTSVQKDYDITPFAITNQETRGPDRFQNKARGVKGREFTMSDLDYGKFQGGAYAKSSKPAQSTQFLINDPKSYGQVKYFVTEGSYHVESSHLEQPEYIDNQTFSQYFLNEAQPPHLLQLGNSYDNLRNENPLDTPIYTSRQLNTEQDLFTQVTAKKAHKKRWSGLGYLESQKEFGANLKKTAKGRSNVSVASKTETHPRRFSEFTNGSQEQGRKVETILTMENYEKIEQNNISDGVEYRLGGVGATSSMKKRHNSRSRNLMQNEISIRPPKVESLSNARQDTVDDWKQDIMRIKKDIEIRKRSHAEVNKFVKMYEDEAIDQTGKESRESLPDNHFSRRNSNLSRISKLEGLKQNGLDTLGGQDANQAKRKDRRKKISFEMKTTEDCEDQRSAFVHRDEHTVNVQNGRVKTMPHYNFTHDTNEVNTSFIHDENVILEKAEKTPCCGSGKMCNIF